MHEDGGLTDKNCKTRRSKNSKKGEVHVKLGGTRRASYKSNTRNRQKRINEQNFCVQKFKDEAGKEENMPGTHLSELQNPD